MAGRRIAVQSERSARLEKFAQQERDGLMSTWEYVVELIGEGCTGNARHLS